MSTSQVQTVAVLSKMPPKSVESLFRQPIRISLAPELQGNRTYELAFAFAANLLARVFPFTYSDYVPDAPLFRLLKRPITSSSSLDPPVALELVFGARQQMKAEKYLYVSCSNWQVMIGDAAGQIDQAEPWNPILALITACYAVARATSVLFGDVISASELLRPFSILDFRAGRADFDWCRTVEAGDVHVAGIGAVGTAFLFALSAHGQMNGAFRLIDEDGVEPRNLDNYSLFSKEDLGKKKTVRAKMLLDRLHLPAQFASVPQKLQDYVNQQTLLEPGFKIEKLISAPDRRETRRQFQGLLPRRVWDASTGPDDLVLHHNDFNPERACLACVYNVVPDEDAHLRHVADVLNLPPERVRAGQQITEADAERIRQWYPKLADAELVGRAYDSVFKELCSSGQLRIEDEVVLTPFPFVSALTGILLYFDFLQSLRPDAFRGFQNYNYLRLNPFCQPNASYRLSRAARSDCPVCKNPTVRRVFERLWREVPLADDCFMTLS